MVELLGLSRLLGKREQVEVRVSPHGPLSRLVAALADAVPALVGVAIDVHGDRLAPGYLLNRNGREPLLEEEVLRPVIDETGRLEAGRAEDGVPGSGIPFHGRGQPRIDISFGRRNAAKLEGRAGSV